MPPEPPPQSPETRTFICTVVFVDLVGYSERAVTQQGMLKRYLNEIIGRSLTHVGESDRMALDTGDGAALCFFGDPEDALFAAANLREAVATDPGPAGGQVRIGINLGPARIVRDLNGNRNIIGDGINVAQRVMGFAAPNQILVSRSFYEVVSHISHEHAQLFQYAGLHRDKHIREHELYEFQVVAGPGAALSSDVGVAGPDVPAGGGEPVVFSPELLARLTAAPEGRRAPGPITPKTLSVAEEKLARHLGPIARVLVAQAAREANDTGQLAARLALHIADPAARRAFLASMDEGQS